MVMDLHTDKSIGEVLTDVIPCVAAGCMLQYHAVFTWIAQHGKTFLMAKHAELHAWYIGAGIFPDRQRR